MNFIFSDFSLICIVSFNLIPIFIISPVLICHVHTYVRIQSLFIYIIILELTLDFLNTQSGKSKVGDTEKTTFQILLLQLINFY